MLSLYIGQPCHSSADTSPRQTLMLVAFPTISGPSLRGTTVFVHFLKLYSGQIPSQLHLGKRLGFCCIFNFVVSQHKWYSSRFCSELPCTMIGLYLSLRHSLFSTLSLSTQSTRPRKGALGNVLWITKGKCKKWCKIQRGPFQPWVLKVTSNIVKVMLTV